MTDPATAFREGAARLRSVADAFDEIATALEGAPPSNAEHALARARAFRVEDMEFSIRTMNCLRNAGIKTMGDLANMSKAELMRVPNFGARSLRLDVLPAMEKLGLRFK